MTWWGPTPNAADVRGISWNLAMSRHDATRDASAGYDKNADELPTPCSTSLCLTTTDSLRLALALLFS